MSRDGVAGQQGFVQLGVFLRHAVEREFGFRATAGGFAHPGRLGGIVQQPQDRGGEGRRIARRHQQAGFAIANGVLGATGSRSHDGPARGHGLQRRQRESLED